MTRKEMRQHLALHAPITEAMAIRAFGATPNLASDSERAAFFAVWALLVQEWAEAALDQLEPSSGGNRSA